MVNRELKCNQGLRGYCPKRAQYFYKQRHAFKPKKVKLMPSIKRLISNRLRKDWSPEQIQGRLKDAGYDYIVPTVIYTLIRQDKAKGGNLYKHLLHKRYKRRSSGGDLGGYIRGRGGIEHRPNIVNIKTRLRDWETDTVIGKVHKGVLVTLTERRSRLTLIALTESKKAEVVLTTK